MSGYRYVLEPYSGSKSRFNCPLCNSKSSYSRYLDLFKDEYLPLIYGRCNREIKCSYHLNPYKDGYGLLDSSVSLKQNPILKRHNQASESIKPSFIPSGLFTQSLQRYDQNRFVNFLQKVFPVQTVDFMTSLYHIGTAKHFPGGTIFWQIDTNGNVRTGKIMQYDPITGHRIKKPRAKVHWVHKLLNEPEFSLKQCLFGEHLLNKFDSMPVAIVESEKTAIICSVFRPEKIWLATGSLSNLSEKLCHVLIERDVTLFPDKNGFIGWSQKAEKLKNFKNLKISDYLEKLTEGIESGGDLADYFLSGK